MDVIASPAPLPDSAQLFLAGGISNCPLWQDDALVALSQVDGVVINPRRPYQMDLVSADAATQIEWEHEALRRVESVLFWFPMETMCPITLLELGVFTQRLDVPLFVGTHPDYARRFDVITQLRLARPEVIVRDDLHDVVNEYVEFRSRN